MSAAPVAGAPAPETAPALADELAEKSEGVGGLYGSFLDEVVIPNAEVFGWLIVAGALRAVRRERPAASPSTGKLATD